VPIGGGGEKNVELSSENTHGKGIIVPPSCKGERTWDYGEGNFLCPKRKMIALENGGRPNENLAQGRKERSGRTRGKRGEKYGLQKRT